MPDGLPAVGMTRDRTGGRGLPEARAVPMALAMPQAQIQGVPVQSLDSQRAVPLTVGVSEASAVPMAVAMPRARGVPVQGFPVPQFDQQALDQQAFAQRMMLQQGMPLEVLQQHIDHVHGAGGRHIPEASAVSMGFARNDSEQSIDQSNAVQAVPVQAGHVNPEGFERPAFRFGARRKQDRLN